MTDSNETHTGQTKPSMQLRIDTSNNETHYMNIFRLSRMPEELLLDVGMTSVDIGSTDGKAVPQMVMKYPTRLVMTYSTAKRLAIAFGQTVKEYEDKHGTISINPSDQENESTPQSESAT